MGSFSLLLHSIEPRHLTHQSHPCSPWAPKFLLIAVHCIHHIIINIHYDDDVMEQKHDLFGGDACKRSNRCALPRHLSVLVAGSWHPFWFDHIFCSMIFGRLMANIGHGGGSRMVAFWPFSEVVRCGVCVFLAVTWRRSKKPVPLFLRVPLILGSSLGGVEGMANW